jgi:predicted nucleic acid-binding protein
LCGIETESLRFGRALFAKLLELIDADDRIQVVSASNSHFQRGVELYLRRHDKSWSLTDCIRFVIMERRRIKEALTGDHHFAQAGFTPLLAEESGS